MPLWLLIVVISYAGALLLAALWAVVERTRRAKLERERRLPDPAAPQVVGQTN